jgi:single-strand DNA-binding protein
MATAQRAEGTDNAVLLRGRLATEPVIRELPSGDELWSFRVTVRRSDSTRVDSIECATTNARSKRALSRAQPGDEVEVSGSLRRRFWRSATGPASRYEVEVATVRITARQRSGAAQGRTPASA